MADKAYVDPKTGEVRYPAISGAQEVRAKALELAVKYYPLQGVYTVEQLRDQFERYIRKGE